MVCSVGVAEFWCRGDLDASCAFIDKKQCVFIFVGDAPLKPEKISQIAAGDIPFLAIQDVVITVADRVASSPAISDPGPDSVIA